jgi:hypothetical protein
MTDTPNVRAPLWAAAESSPWLQSGKRARIFDAFAFGTIVEAIDQTAPPGSCADGARYLVHSPATGAWAGHEGELAIAVGANASNGWYFATVAVDGMLLRNRANSTNYRFHSGSFVAFPDTVTRFQDLLDVVTTGLADGFLFAWDASNGSLFPVDPARFLSSLSIDTDGTMAANSDVKVASQKAVKTYVDTAVTGVHRWKGATDCSANPNYPAAVKGDAYTVSVAGKIGGASGSTVDVGDVFIATADNAGGTQAAVGSSWVILEHNLVSALAASFASAAEVQAGSSSSKVIAPDALQTAAAPQTLTDGATINWDMAAGFNAKVTLGGSRALATPTNPKVGLSYTLEVIQDGTGSRGLTLPAAFKFGSAGAPTFSTGAGKRDFIFLYCYDAGTPEFRAVFNKDA